MINENIASIFWELISQGHSTALLNGENIIAASGRQIVEALMKKFPRFQQELNTQGYFQEGLLDVDRAAIVSEAAIKFKLYYSKTGADDNTKFKVMHNLEYRSCDAGTGCRLDSHACFISQEAGDFMDNIRRLHFYNAADGSVPTIMEAYEMTLLIAPEMPTLRQTMEAVPKLFEEEDRKSLENGLADLGIKIDDKSLPKVKGFAIMKAELIELGYNKERLAAKRGLEFDKNVIRLTLRYLKPDVENNKINLANHTFEYRELPLPGHYSLERHLVGVTFDVTPERPAEDSFMNVEIFDKKGGPIPDINTAFDLVYKELSIKKLESNQQSAENSASSRQQLRFVRKADEISRKTIKKRKGKGPRPQ